MLDTVFTVLSLVLYATPVFWLGLMLVLVFSVTLGWLPPFGYETINVQLSPIEHALDIMKHMIMPVTSLAAIYLAIYARLMRSSIIEVAQQDFIKTARAKGLSGPRIVVGHMLRNALVPVVTVAGMQAGALVGGAVVIETVFAWPGLGRLTFEAAAAARLSGAARYLPDPLDRGDRTQSPDRPGLSADRSAYDHGGGLMDTVRAFLRHPSGMIGLVLLLVVVVVAIIAPIVFPVSPWEMVGAPFTPPGEDGMWLGGDTLGRDVAAGVAYGARVSLLIGIASALAAMAIGVVVGAISGYFGGKVDLVLMRMTELFQTIPAFVLAILLVATFNPSLLTIILTIGAVSWPPLARLTRAEFLRLRHREFVEAAICQGERTWRIVLGHILPNAISPILVVTSLTVATAILLESALSFMGLGDPNLMSWGFMIGAGRTVIRNAWWMSVFPGLAILLTVLAINLFGEGLSDVLNPRVSRRRS